MRALIVFVLGISVVWLTGCASVQRESAVQVSPDLLAGLPTPYSAPEIAFFKGKPYLLWYNARGQLVFQHRGQEQIVSEGSPPGAAPSYIVHLQDDKGVYVFWRAKLKRAVEGVGRPGDKLIYFRASYDGAGFGTIHKLNQQGGAFLPRVATNGRDTLYAVWMDERASTKYDLYFNVSRNNGRSWKERDMRINTGEPGGSLSINPTIVAEGNAVWIAWTEYPSYMPGTQPAYMPGTRPGSYSLNSLMVRGSSDQGESWGNPVVISQEEQGPTGLALVKMPAVRGNRLVLYWYTQQGFRGAYSEDEGRTWTPFAPLPGIIDPPDELKIAQDPSGRVYLVAGTRPEGKREDLFAAVSEDGVRFNQPVRLDTNLPHLSTSTEPQIAMDGKGRVLIAWQDLRNFRHDIYFNFSTDGGKSWLKEDLRVGAEGVLHGYHPRLVADGQGGFHLSWIGYADDKRELGKFLSAHIVPGELRSTSGGGNPPEAVRKARLRERVAQFWGDRLKADWGGNYDLMDPFFKQTTIREYYIANQFKTVYHAFDIKQAKIEENRADVTIRYTLEIPEMFLASGQKVRIPKREEEITEEWIWIDGDWFRVFKDMMGGDFLPR